MTEWAGKVGSTLVIVEDRAMSRPASALVSVNRNPNRARCPLCRRVNTVELQSQESADRGKVVSNYRCTYSGCRNIEFTI